MIALLLCVLLASAGGAAEEKRAAAGEKVRPDLLLVTLDTTRADALGCYGGPATPTLDALAEEGTLFERALSPAPLTLPSHAALFTGQSPRLNGVRDNALFRLAPGQSTLAERLRAEGYDTLAVIGAVVLDRSTGFDQGFRLYDDTVRVGRREWFGWQERGASQVTDRALELAGEIASPLFLWVHYYDPHLPYVPPEPHRSRHPGKPYLGEVAYVDAELGRLLKGLEARGTSRPLLVVVAGDHGEGLGAHGEAGHGIFVYQSTQHVPLILRGPGAPKGRRVGPVVGLVDLTPTILELIGLPAPADVQGRSLVPLLSDRGADKAPVYEIESLHPALSYGWAPLRGVVTGGLKYIAAPEDELYDLESDPGETRNLAAERPSEAARMKRIFERRFGDDHFAQLAIPEAPDEEAAEQLDRLLALGYLAGSQPEGGPVIDPKAGVALLARLERSQGLMAEGKAREAIPTLEEILVENPQNLPALMTLGAAYLAAGEPSRAIAVHRRAVQLNPALHLTHFTLARALIASKDPALRVEAVQELRASLAIFPRHAESWNELVQLALATGKREEARALLLRAESKGVDDPGLSLRRGVIEASLGNAEAAERAFGRVLELDPTQERAHLGLARLAQSRGDSARAAEEYRRALELEPRAATARVLGSILIGELGDPAGAREAFARAVELDPEAPESAALRELLPQLELMAAAAETPAEPAGEVSEENEGRERN